MNKFRFLSFFLIASAPIFLGGCLGDIQGWACSFFDDPDHCFQSAAVQGGDPTGCEKIKGEGVSILLVEQNAAQSLAISDQAYILEEGRIGLSGTGVALLNDDNVRRLYLGVDAE